MEYSAKILRVTGSGGRLSWPGWSVWVVLLVVWVCAEEVRAADRVVARGEGVVVRQSDLDQMVVEQKVFLQSTGRRLTEEEEALLEVQTLDRLVVRQILLGMSTAEEREAARALVAEKVKEQKAKLGSEEAYRRLILKGGAAPDEFEARLVNQATSDQVIAREVKSKLVVTEEQVREFYDYGTDRQAQEVEQLVERLRAEGKDSEAYRDATNRLAIIRSTNLERLVRPEQARARMLVVFTKDPITGRLLSADVRESKRERLERLRRRVLAGEDFAVLAPEFSEEPDARANQAEYWATKEKVTLPALRRALFELPLTELSSVIQTDLGLYLVQVLERPQAGKASFEEAREEIRGWLTEQEVQHRLPRWFEELKQAHEVEVVKGP